LFIASPITASGVSTFDKPAAEPVVSVRGLTKAYGVVEALRDVSIDFHAGEIHAVVGENGAGKSTLTRLLGGEEAPDAGDILVSGRKTIMQRPVDAKREGIALVHQQFQLVEALTVAQNICLENPPTRRLAGVLPVIDGREVLRRAVRQLAPFNLEGRAGAEVRDLTVAERQVVEISRELAKDARLLILDEPTSALSADETETLFAHIRALRDRGVAILFIAHSLTEVLAIADRITVLRDGGLVTTVPARTLDAGALSQLIVGREIAKPVQKAARSCEGDVVLEANSGGTRIEVRRGEILGIPTYIGSAVRDLLDRLSGMHRTSAGGIRFKGKDIGRDNIGARVREGIGFVPGDSNAEGLIPKLSVEDNILLPSIARFTRLGIIDRQAGRRAARELIESLDIRPSDPLVPVERLSGGNRQKVAIAKWLLAGADVLIMDDPARGVDVGAKVELYRVIAGQAEKGGAVVLASSDLDELLALSDRMVVLRGEAVIATFPERPFGKADIVRMLATRPEAAVAGGAAS
jgi:ribose transport system ATP-binding protein